jgi:hypothetical protein
MTSLCVGQQVLGAASEVCGGSFPPPRDSWTGEKCEFAFPEVQFLGHHVTAEGIWPLPDRVAAIPDHPRHTTVKQLQAFLGVVIFYCRFVPAAKILQPITDSVDFEDGEGVC